MSLLPYVHEPGDDGRAVDARTIMSAVWVVRSLFEAIFAESAKLFRRRRAM
jgi:hypothetical protein